MTASPKLPYSSAISQIRTRRSSGNLSELIETVDPSRAIPKHGVLCLYGFGVICKVDRGHLYCSWGIADDRHTIRLPKVNSGLRRLVMIGSEGFITLEALRWISDRD